MIVLILLSLFLGLAEVAWYGLEGSFWYVWLALSAVAAVAWFFPGRSASGVLNQKRLSTIIWVLLAYVAFQLVPLPQAILRILSPARAGLNRAISEIVPGNSFAPLSVHPALTWENLMRIAACALVFVTICAFYQSSRDWSAAFPVLLVAFAEAVLGLTQYALNPAVERAHGTLVNPDHFSAFLEMALPFAVMFSALNIARWRTGPETRRWGYAVRAGVGAILSIIFLAAIAFALSRIGLVAAAIGVTMCGILSLPRKWPVAARAAIAFGLLVVSALGVLAIAPARLAARVSGMSSERSFIDPQRLGVWSDTLHMIAAYPAFGSGLGTYGSAFVKYQTSDLEHAVIYAHNDYLQSAAELGILGMAIAAALAAVLLFRLVRVVYAGAHRQERFLALACVGALTAIAIHSVFDFNLYIAPVAIAVAWVAGMGAGLGLETQRLANEDEEEQKPASHPMRAQAVALACLLAAYSLTALFTSRQLASHPGLERVLCHVGLCADEPVAAAAYQKLSKPGERNEATADFARLLLRDPASPFAWCNLGQAFLSNGHSDAAANCWGRAQDLAPNHPVVLLRVANYFANIGQKNIALRDGTRVLAVASTFDNAVFQLQHNLSASVAEVIGSGDFPGCRAARSYFFNVAKSNAQAQLPQVWKWLLAKGCADEATTSTFVDFLFERSQYTEAVAAWTAFVGREPAGNLLFDGGFERAPGKCPLDWLLKDPDRVNVVHAAGQAREGSGVLRMLYAKALSPPADPVSQTVYLGPGRYRLEAEIRLQNFQSDHGVAFSVIDPAAPAQFTVTSKPLTGTQPWQKIALRFTISGKPRLFQVQVVQMKTGIVFDSNLTGTAWIDNAKLARE